MAANQIKPVVSNQIERNNQIQNPSVRMVNAQRTEAFSGPLPHPDHLERYGQIVKDGAERIFKMAEAQADHRMETEKSIVQADINLSNKGLLYGFVIALVITGSGTWITLQDKSPVGLIAMLTPLVSIIGLFIYNRQTKSKDNEETTSPPKKKK